MNIAILIAAVTVVLLVRVVLLAIKPYKACGYCRGRGYCAFCNYRGKVLRFGARWVRPSLRKKQ